MLSAGPITVSATSKQRFDLDVDQVVGGGLAVGAVWVDLDVGSNATAGVANGAQIGQSDTVSSLAVTADSTVDVDSLVVGVTGGAIGMSVNFDFVNVHPVVAASIGDNAMVTTSGAIDVNADTHHNAVGSVVGVSVLGAFNAALSWSEERGDGHADGQQHAGDQRQRALQRQRR